METKIPNKVKVFAWRACNDILPTKMNLVNQRIIADASCPICTRFPETAVMCFGIVMLLRMCGQVA